MENVIINIQGMSCGGCTSSVTKAIQAIDGVSQVEVTLKPGQANVTYDNTKTSLNELQHAIEDAGFEVIN